MTIMWRMVACLAAALLIGGPLPILAQNPDAPAPPAKPQFFGGTVTELDETHIKVSRKLVGRPLESRTFTIDANTKMNKAAIHIKGRVTVRYRRGPEGDLALEVQVRPPARSKAP
jgi:hypothetical protein